MTSAWDGNLHSPPIVASFPVALSRTPAAAEKTPVEHSHGEGEGTTVHKRHVNTASGTFSTLSAGESLTEREKQPISTHVHLFISNAKTSIVYIRIRVAKNIQSICNSGNRHRKIALRVTLHPATGSVHVHVGVVEPTPLRLEGEERDGQAGEEDYKLEEEDRRSLLAAVHQGDSDEWAEDAPDPAH